MAILPTTPTALKLNPGIVADTLKLSEYPPNRQDSSAQRTTQLLIVHQLEKANANLLRLLEVLAALLEVLPAMGAIPVFINSRIRFHKYLKK